MSFVPQLTHNVSPPTLQIIKKNKRYTSHNNTKEIVTMKSYLITRGV